MTEKAIYEVEKNLKDSRTGSKLLPGLVVVLDVDRADKVNVGYPGTLKFIQNVVPDNGNDQGDDKLSKPTAKANKETLQAYLKQEGIDYSEDATNSELFALIPED